jgi:hypothetical protein
VANKEEIIQSVKKYDKTLDEIENLIRDSIKKIDTYKESFNEQRILMSRLYLSEKILSAAISHLENLRPRISMIEDNEEILATKMKILSKKTFKGIKKK